MKKGVAIIMLSLSTIACFAGGPWPSGRFSGYAQFGIFTIPPTNRFWIKNYQTQYINRPVLDFTFSLYGEYGLSDKWTIMASLPTKLVGTLAYQPIDAATLGTAFAPSDSLLSAGMLFDLGNVSIAGKYSFLNKNGWVAAAAMQVNMPTAIRPYNPQTALRTAVPAWGFQPTLSVGKGADKYYTFLELGANFRTNNYDHQLIGQWEFGYKIIKKAYLAFTVQLNYGLGSADDTPNSDEDFQTGLSVNNQDFVAFTLKWMQPINENFGMNISFGGGLWANNVQQGPAFGLAVYYKWKKKNKETIIVQ